MYENVVRQSTLSTVLEYIFGYYVDKNCRNMVGTKSRHGGNIFESPLYVTENIVMMSFANVMS